jgi:osmotically-inducible protein OsmY
MKLTRQLILVSALLILLLTFACQTMTSNSVVETPQETVLSQSVRDRLLADHKNDLSGVKVESSAGTVNLSGTVKSLDARDHAIKIAWGVRGVQTVENHLIVGN